MQLVNGGKCRKSEREWEAAQSLQECKLGLGSAGGLHKVGLRGCDEPAAMEKDWAPGRDSEWADRWEEGS